jgi:hypothetical protein
MVYKRNQLEGALHALLHSRPSKARLHLGREVPQLFRVRLKRLLEIDREWGHSNLHGLQESGLAFYDTLPDGRGYDVSYSAQRAFNMAVALRLVEFGFKQKEVVEQVALLQPQLEYAFARATATLQTHGRTRQKNDAFVSLKTKNRSGSSDQIDYTIFLIVHQVEASNRTADLSGGTIEAGEELIAPRLSFGWEHLEADLRDLIPRQTTSVFLIELAELAARLMELLDEQPMLRRGRRKH